MKTTGRVVFYHKFCIWVYPQEWDKLQYLADGENKTVSRYIVDKIAKCKVKVPKNIERDKSQKGRSRPLSCDEREWGMIQDKIEKSGLTATRYIINVALAEN